MVVFPVSGNRRIIMISVAFATLNLLEMKVFNANLSPPSKKRLKIHNSVQISIDSHVLAT